MPILFPIGSYYPAQSGGPSNGVYWLAKALASQGLRVTVVATSQDLPPDVPLNSWILTKYGRVIYIRTRFPRLSLAHLFRSMSQFREADIIHLTSLFYPPSLLLAVVAVAMRKKIVWSPHGELAPDALQYRRPPKQIILALIRRLSPRVVFHSTCDAETQFIRQHCPDRRIFQMPNLIELPPLIERRPANYLLYIGRLHPIKALDRLLMAASQSSGFQQGDWVLILAGPDNSPYARELKQLAGELEISHKVNFIGAVTGEQKQQLYADAHVTFLPSHSENFGFVVTESLAQGTPVIASTGTPWQLLETERAGIWIPNDPASLTRAIDRFLTMPASEYQTFRRQSLRLVRKHFDVYEHGARWATFYRQLISQP